MSDAAEELEQLKKVLEEVRAHVYLIYAHYSKEEVKASVKSNNGSQLCHYGQAMEILDAALAGRRRDLRGLAERQRDACAQQVQLKSGAEYEIPRRIAMEVAEYVRLTPLVTEKP